MLTNCVGNVENFFVCQFGRDAGGIGGGRRGPGDNWNGHRREGDDDDQKMDARPEERFGEWASEEGHDLLVFGVQKTGQLEY